MQHTPTSARFHRFVHFTVSHGFPCVMRYTRLTFVSGPKKLLTSRISGKCAACMMMMCSPALLFCALLTIPAMLFQSPQQHAYFYFAQTLDHDPARWIVLTMSAICVIMSLAVPATMPGPRDPYY